MGDQVFDAGSIGFRFHLQRGLPPGRPVEQDQAQHQVALKVRHAGLVFDELRRRFEFETSVLARLQYPGIAQIYEAGAWDAGSGSRPFFAMELVNGVPLDNFVAQARPSIEARLELFDAICDAVQHAHQKGVIPP